MNHSGRIRGLFIVVPHCPANYGSQASGVEFNGTMHDSTIEISREVMFQEVGGETVLLDLESEQYFGLDKVGTRIWKLINDGATTHGLVERLLKEYEVERPQLERDVSDLLNELAAAGLIRLVQRQS